MNFKTRFTTAIATGAVLLNALAPAAFANTITVTGNGAYSNNTVNTVSSTNTVVSQSNNANVSNNVDSSASTGGNDANYNTGGDVTVKTGDASTNVAVSNDLNTNAANVSGCGTCGGGATNVTVSGNGAYSDNTANVLNASNVFVNQTNNANVSNNVDADAKTGGNDAKYNTGGDVTIDTGDASTNVSVNTEANRNWATVGGGAGISHGSSIQILGNGANSDNAVNLANESAVVLGQANDANVHNNVDADAKTGGNDANYNAGGDVTVKTGDADANAEVNNSVNFNAADVDCGCLLGDLDVKIAGNGADSENEVNAASENGLFVIAENEADLCNDVDADAKTGDNDAKYNTGDVNGDPSVLTGDAESSTSISNDGNVNVYGAGAMLPDMDVDFDMSGFLAWFHFWSI